MLALYDVMPTFCELIGERRSPKKYLNKKIKGDCFDGISLASTLLGDDVRQQKHEFLYWEFHETNQIGIGMGNWKLIIKKGKNICIIWRRIFMKTLMLQRSILRFCNKW